MSMAKSHILPAFWNALILVAAFRFDLNSEHRSNTKDIIDVRALKKPNINKGQVSICEFDLVHISHSVTHPCKFLAIYLLQVVLHKVSEDNFRNLILRWQIPWYLALSPSFAAIMSH